MSKSLNVVLLCLSYVGAVATSCIFFQSVYDAKIDWLALFLTLTCILGFSSLLNRLNEQD